MSTHHPSCRPSDRDLVWLCAQCGGHESAEDILEDNTRLRGTYVQMCAEALDAKNLIAALRDQLHQLKKDEQVAVDRGMYWMKQTKMLEAQMDKRDQIIAEKTAADFKFAQRLRAGVEHLKQSNHGYKPDSCSACGDIP